jgi:hypothetical protein
MFTNEIVNAEMQRDRMLVRFEVFAVSERFTPKSLQFLPDGQECALYVARGKAF